MRKHFPVQLHPWRCIHWYILTPDDVSDNTCWPLTMYCVLNFSRVRNPIHNFFFTRLSRKCFPIIENPIIKILYLYMECFIDPSIAMIMIIEVQIFKKKSQIRIYLVVLLKLWISSLSLLSSWTLYLRSWNATSKIFVYV